MWLKEDAGSQDHPPSWLQERKWTECTLKLARQHSTHPAGPALNAGKDAYSLELTETPFFSFPIQVKEPQEESMGVLGATHQQ